jgi:flagellar protein FliO/FliZ
MMKMPLLQTFSAIAGLIAGTARAAEEKAPVSSVLADNNVTSHLLQTTLGLLAVLAVIIAIGWAVKRFGNLRGGVQGQMKIVGGLSLGTRERVVLLQVGEQQLVLGVAPGQIRTLHVLDQPLSADDGNAETPAVDNADAPSFAMRMQSALKSRGMG